MKSKAANTSKYRTKQILVYSFSFLSLTACVPALLHQATVGQGPHDPHGEDHDDDEGQEELSDGEEEELGQAAARVLESGGEEGVGDHDGKEPDRDTHAFGHAGVPPPTGGFNLQGHEEMKYFGISWKETINTTHTHRTHLHDGKVAVDTYAGEEQDAAVHVDKVAEDVQVGAGETGPPAVVEQDASGQGEIHQEVGHRQVDGVDHGAGPLLGAETEHVQGHHVEHHAYLETRGPEDERMGGTGETDVGH